MVKVMAYLQLTFVAFLMFLLHCAYSLTHDVTHDNSTVELDADADGTNKECGRVINLMAGNETTMKAHGHVPNGDCMVAFRAMSNKNYKCSKLCVTLRNKKMETCDVQIRFTAISFSRNTHEIKIFDCRNRFTDSWCPQTDVLQVNIVESDEYLIHALSSKRKRLYEFVGDVSPVCVAIKTGQITAEEAYHTSKSRQITEDRMRKNRIEGVVVAVCLSSIFLVVMFVFYCYYKSKATDGPPDENQEYAKVSAFTGFRTKFLPKRKKKSRRRTSEEEPKLISHSPRPRPATSQDYITSENPQKLSTSSASTAVAETALDGNTAQGITDSTATLEIGAEGESKPLVVGKYSVDGNDS